MEVIRVRAAALREASIFWVKASALVGSKGDEARVGSRV
jgi:hypothetical protein